MDLQNLAAFVLLLGALVFVHELGHFLAAKAVGVKVLRFSIGFGPPLLSFTRGETEYRIAALPLGGYVKMAGEVPGEDATPEDEARSYLAQSPWKRMLIVAAGPAFNLLFPLLIFFAVIVSYPQPSTQVLRVVPGMPADQAGIRVGDVVTEVDGRPVRSLEEMQWALVGKAGRRIPVVVQRDGQRVQLLVTPSGEGASRNRGLIGIAPNRAPPVVGVVAGGPAERAGVQTLDRVLSVNGRPVADLPALEREIAGVSGPELSLQILRRVPAEVPGLEASVPEVETVRVPRQDGTSMAAFGLQPADIYSLLYVGRVLPGSAAADAGLVRGDRLEAIDGKQIRSREVLLRRLGELKDRPFRLTWVHQGTPHDAEVRMRPAKAGGEAAGADSEAFELGIRFESGTPGDKGSDAKVRVGPGLALVTAAHRLGEAVADTAAGLGKLVTGQVSFRNVGGPIMIYGIAGKAAQAGLDYFLNLMALISVNLGLINLVPIPALDGFQLLSAAWEAVRRRPIPMRAREIANAVGIVALIVLMVLVCVNDLTR
ncbi:MAG TPA: RIP metalloprotease RseP [Myxococcaceae bacterium]|nr:RIP metalloprotease RseP [Myxococcaceae bacterium]